MSFRLTTILWVVAVVGAAMATFGPAGLCVAVAVIWIWAYVFAAGMRRNRVKRFLGVVLAFILGLLLIALLLASVTTPREAARRNQCLSQIKQLALALHLYHDAHNEFPPAYLADATGKPTLSWRVLILPFAEEPTLYHRFDLAKAWNDPANSSVQPAQQLICTCPSNQLSAFDSDYFAVVAPNTLWPGSGSLTKSQVTDGLSNTIALIEVHGRNVNWAEPRDLSFDEAITVLTSVSKRNDGHRIKPSFLDRQIVGRHIVFADGRGMFLYEPMDRDLAKALLTANGGEDIGAELARFRERNGRIPWDYAAIYSLIAFIAVALLPLTRVSRTEDSEA